MDFTRALNVQFELHWLWHAISCVIALWWPSGALHEGGGQAGVGRRAGPCSEARAGLGSVPPPSPCPPAQPQERGHHLLLHARCSEFVQGFSSAIPAVSTTAVTRRLLWETRAQEATW